MKFQAHSSLEPPLKYNPDQTPLTNQGSLWGVIEILWGVIESSWVL